MDIYLIDGNAYLYRAYYAMPGLTNSKGKPTGAAFGFTTMLLKLIEDRRPDAVAVCFDTAHPTERHELFEHYKANRSETPDDLLAQFEPTKQILDALTIPVIETPGYEADDALATLAMQGIEKGHRVFIVTSDKDMLQLVGPMLKVYDPIKNRVLDESYVQERFSLPPERVVEYMALVGDASDNIPGVKGIGDKTAKTLLAQFSSLDELFSRPQEIKNLRVRGMIENGRDSMELSLALATINRQVPMGDISVEKFGLGAPDTDRLRTIFSELEFSSLLRSLPRPPQPQGLYETVLDAARLRERVSHITDTVAFDVETTGTDPLRDKLVGFSMSTATGSAFYVPLRHAYPGAPAQIEQSLALALIAPVMADEGIRKIGHNLKFDIAFMASHGVPVKGPLLDTMVASYLINPLRTSHSLEDLCIDRLGRTKTPFKEVLAWCENFSQVPLDRAGPYAAMDSDLAFELSLKLFAELNQQGLEHTYYDIEMPLVSLLAQMESTGILVDTEGLSGLGKELERELEALGQRIYFIAGEQFNINSPKQLGKVLFENLGLQPTRKNKTGFSTDMAVLEELAKVHELPGEIITWRSLSKLKNTYTDVLLEKVNPNTGRLHTSFNQTVTATGRLSSSEPNLQNIPVRGPWGGRIRGCFIAPPGSLILSADYSQIELRVLAHMCQDASLLEAFASGADVHTGTAAKLFGVPESGVSQEMRRVAKSVNFGVIYGQSAFGLAGGLGISRAQADKFIKDYFARYPGVNAFIAHCIETATKEGYTETLGGRKRPMPELQSKDRNTKNFGERLAINTPIQGSAADIIKLAMINVQRALDAHELKTKMLLQVHDELVFEVPEGELEQASEIIKKDMEGAFPLSVPLTVQLGSGPSWAEAHG